MSRVSCESFEHQNQNLKVPAPNAHTTANCSVLQASVASLKTLLAAAGEPDTAAESEGKIQSRWALFDCKSAHTKSVLSSSGGLSEVESLKCELAAVKEDALDQEEKLYYQTEAKQQLEARVVTLEAECGGVSEIHQKQIEEQHKASDDLKHEIARITAEHEEELAASEARRREMEMEVHRMKQELSLAAAALENEALGREEARDSISTLEAMVRAINEERSADRSELMAQVEELQEHLSAEELKSEEKLQDVKGLWSHAKCEADMLREQLYYGTERTQKLQAQLESVREQLMQKDSILQETESRSDHQLADLEQQVGLLSGVQRLLDTLYCSFWCDRCNEDDSELETGCQ